MNMHGLFMSYWVSRTLIAGVELGIFDRLAAGPQTAAQVAAALKLNPDAAERLLHALAALGVVAQQGNHYSNTPYTQLALVKGSPQYIGGIAHQHGEQLWPLWAHLATAVREGRPVLREAFGGDRNPFTLFAQKPDVLAKMLAGMDAGARGMGEAAALAHNFGQHHHLIDVGGGTGVVSGPIAQRYPHLQATIFDLPAVTNMVGPLLGRFGCGPRLTAHGGDFFRPETFPKGADAAIITRVLHDWDDPKALAILRNTWQALQPGGTVLVMESLLDGPDPGSRLFAALSNLTMLVLTDGGRERTGTHYEALLREAGFTGTATQRLASGPALIKGLKL